MSYRNVAALTIVSKNYIPAARVLAESFLNAHPDATFYVLLVDELDGEFDPAGERFELLSFDSVGLPRPDIFAYQYGIMELNTAVKPFALESILKNRPDLEKVAYIDPDIWVFRPLEDVWSGLDEGSIVLTPHMRRPFNDNGSPSETEVLQSGTYNLGFIALRNDDNALALLEWWEEKLYLDCVVDIPNGLFVDQKWMDLVPGYFGGTVILRNPAYNVAYWNLHERSVEVDEVHGYTVDGIRLAFFHFSGYDPRRPDRLSKHQNRHALKNLPVVERLCSEYGKKLLGKGYREAKEYKYAFAVLGNGVPVNQAFHRVIRNALRQGMKLPSPRNEPDEFCRFLMTPSRAYAGKAVAPLVTELLEIRKDVAGHFPGAGNDPLQAGFREWLDVSGRNEEGLGPLLDGFGAWLTTKNDVRRAIDIYRNRVDVQREFPRVADCGRDFDRFCDWLATHAPREMGVPEWLGRSLKSARNAYVKAMYLYLLRSDLQKTFPKPFLQVDVTRYADWMRTNLPQLKDISENEVEWFEYVASAKPVSIAFLLAGYSEYHRSALGGMPTYFGVDRFIRQMELQGLPIERDDAVECLLSVSPFGPLDQLEAHYAQEPDLRESYPAAFRDPDTLRELAREVNDVASERAQSEKERAWLDRMLEDARAYAPLSEGFNVAGYFDAVTGMGESARSMARTLEQSGYPYAVRTQPNLKLDEEIAVAPDDLPRHLGRVASTNRADLQISNADAAPRDMAVWPAHARLQRKRIGYWVWETEELPRELATAAQYFDEIWTPSTYSRDAIAGSVDRPIRVVPHRIDPRIRQRAAEGKKARADFGLPKKSLLFGYFFDQKSFLERKNPRAALEAFVRAFGDRRDAAFVVKVNDPVPGAYAYEKLKAEFGHSNIVWIEKTLSAGETARLMGALDVYVSLHRSEGFGLTVAEAMTAGVPVICTSYGGVTDFLDDDYPGRVSYEPTYTNRPIGPYPSGTRWAEPSVEHASTIMLDCKDGAARRRLARRCRRMSERWLVNALDLACTATATNYGMADDGHSGQAENIGSAATEI